MNGKTPNDGFTLVECLIAATILTVAVLAVSAAIGSAQAQVHYALKTQQAVRLAEALMGRILALPYNDPDGVSSPGPEAGESSVWKFDNMDDFDGYAESAGQIKDAAGNPFPAEYQIFSRSVTVRYETVSVPGLGNIPGLRATVTVRDPAGVTWTLSRFVGA